MMSLNDVKEILRPKGEVYRGMQEVQVKLIVGSEGRYSDFNRYFQPKSDFLRSRWQKVDEAALGHITLPPISLYEIGGVYFVRDGNHRVSVARMQGVEMIDAEVISLTSEMQIDPDMTEDDIKKKVSDYEKDIFYLKTNFGKITEYYDLDFSVPGRYDDIYNHILVHKYYIDQNLPEESSFHDALLSWFDNVFMPIIEVIREEKILPQFPGRTESDLYVFIVKRWDYLKKEEGEGITPLDAAKNFSEKYGEKKNWFFITSPAAPEEKLDNPYDK
ncbi:MAG: transcriptional regulator [Spirochaetaceae bacterium]|nr:transcriptional regulator [Spirochaetaceae bacterium]